MAEFKLGRIKFVWQGAWTTGTSYLVDDVVNVSGKSYICVVNHTASAAFATDLNVVPSKWNIIADGQTWKGNWNTATLYSIGDLVKYGGNVYVCNSIHTSTVAGTTTLATTNATCAGTTATLTFATQSPQAFQIGQTITVSGILPNGYNGTFTVTAANATTVSYTVGSTLTSQTQAGTVYSYGGLEAHTSKWDEFSTSFVWRNQWQTSTRYRLNDFVSYGGYTYVCITPHVSSATATLGLENDSANWQTFNAGIVYLGTWSGSSVRYKLNDVVKSGSDLYICTTQHTSTGTALDITKFSLFLPGFEFENSWSSSTEYQAGDVVTYGGYSYIAKQGHSNQQPSTATAYWGVFTTGFNFIGDYVPSTSYKVGDVVRLHGYTFACIADAPSITQTATGTNVSGAVSVASTTGMLPGMTVSFSAPTVTTTISATGSVGGFVTVGTVTNVQPNMPVVVTGTAIGSLTAGTYYVKSIPSTTAINVSSVSRSSSTVTVNTGTNYTTTATGTSGQSTIVVANASGIILNQKVFGTGIGTDAIVQNIVGTTVTLDVPNSGAVSGTIQFANLSAHGLTSGQSINLNNTGAAGLDQATCVITVVSATQFTFTHGSSGTVNLTYITGATATPAPQVVLSSTAGGTALTSWSNLTGSMTAVIGGVFGGLIEGITYYLVTVNPTSFTFSESIGGSLVSLTTGLGSVTVYTSPQPPSATYWSQLTPGLFWTNTTQSYTAVTTTNVTVSNGSATGAQFTVTRSNTVYTLTRTANGSNYTTGDIIKILGSNVGGLSPANDILITVTASAGAISSQTYTGNSSTWKTATSYVKGDLASFGANSYICITAHTSATGSRPDNDATGTYWNLLAAGAETLTLTTQGDMVYYGANGPVRLPIGTDGQIIRSSNGYPSWANYGLINNLVYVGPLGTDAPAPANGLTIDRPWKTVRYACKQLEEGYLNPNAKSLLQRNKQFFMKEVTGYITSTYKVTVSGTAAGAFTTTNTSGIVANMPIIFSTLTGSLTIGGSAIDTSVTYYVKTVVANTSFTVSATITGGVAGTAATAAGTGTAVGTISYNSATCERDTGLVVDAVIYDLTHGGTTRATAAAKSYYTTAGTAYITTNFGYQATQTVGAYNYLKTIMANVLSNTAVAVSYGTGLTQQLIDSTVTAETTATAAANGLISIITDGITAGSVTAIPVAIQPNTTLSVKTGTYNEVLPIVVPEGVAVVGDELRTTIVQPRPAISLLASDKSKTTAALNRIKAIVPTLMANGTVSATSGNTQTQVTSLYAGSIGSYASLSLVATATTAGSPGYITTSSTANLTPGTPVVFASTIGTNVTASTMFYVYTVINGTTFSLSSSPAINNQTTAVTITNSTGLSVSFTYGITAPASVVANAATMQNVINGSSPSFVLPQPIGYNATYLVGYGSGLNQIVQNYNFIKDDVGQYLSNNYNSVWTALGTAGQALCKRDIGYILDGLQFDMTYGSNIQTLIAGSSYYSNYVLTIAQSEKAAIIAAYGHLKSIISTIVQNNAVSAQAGNSTGQVRTGTQANGFTAAATFAQARIQDIVDWINNGAANATIAPSLSSAGVSSALQTSFAVLQAKRTEIQSDTTAWVRKFYQALSFNSATCYRDAGLIVDALSYDLAFGSNINSIIAGRAYLRGTPSAQVVINSQKAAELGAINFIGNKAKVISTGGASAQASILIDDITAYIAGATMPEVHGTNTYNNTVAMINGAEILRANVNFLAYEASAFITQSYGGTVTTTTASTDLFTLGSNHNFVAGDPVVFLGTTYSGSGIVVGTTYYVLASGLTGTAFKVSATLNGTAIDISTNGSGSSLIVRYSYDAVLCRRDTTEFVNALVYDLQYPGNYKALRAAQLYVNAINGSQLENMYLVRQATGIRNMTLSGLTGVLSAANSYGTKRPTAGAYTSLDPGFGPNDTNAWINTRSCYAQNVTMFGYACSGMKIDGALHSGGNRSIVANDYTTIIGDGIGVWCTGTSALTELVSVFNYYGYAGYLAELGGRIRATNGNSSYGTYGVIAEGTDSSETPIYATLNNRAAQAYITNVTTDGVNKIQRIEYANAGSNYTNYAPSISGAGYNAAAVGDEFRDGAVFETRLIDNGDSTTTSVGGTNYQTAANAAQTGDYVSITLAAADTAISSVYIGMRIMITAGTGVGQYANILTYNNGTKVAKVIRDNFTALTVTATTAGGNNLLTVASTRTLYVGMPIYLGTAIGGLTANTAYYVIAANFSATQFAVSTTSGGSAEPTTLTSAQSVALYAAGWDHAIPGTANAVFDLTTTYIIEPRISYTAPGFNVTQSTPSPTAQWASITYDAGRFVTLGGGGSTVSSFSTTGKTWATGGVLPSSLTWTDVVYGGGQGATATATVGGLGGAGAVLTAVLGVANITGAPLADQVASVTIVNGGYGYTTAPSIVFTSASGSNAVATCTVLNGTITSITVTTPGSGYLTVPTVTARSDRITAITVNSYGKNYTATYQPTVTVSYPNVAASTAYATTTSVALNAYLEVVATGKIYQATVGGTTGSSAPTHVTGAVANGTATLTYVATRTQATAVLSNTGVASITITDPGNNYTSTPTVTILDTNAKFVAIASTGTTNAYQTVAGLTAGSAWTSGSALPSNCGALVYGNNQWVGLPFTTGGSGGAVTSPDGITWTGSGRTTPTLGAGTYSAIAFGGTTYVIIATGNNATAYSTNAQTWSTGGTLPASTTWTSLAYGNGRFVAMAATGRIAYSLDFGVTWLQPSTTTGATTSVLSSSYTWTKIRYGQGLFFALAQGTTVCATSPDGIDWTVNALTDGPTWNAVAFGNPSNNPLWVAVNTNNNYHNVIKTGARALGRVKVNANTITEIRMIEPGSGYPQGTATTTYAPVTVVVNSSSTTVITVASSMSGIVAGQPITFASNVGTLVAGTVYYVYSASGVGTAITGTSLSVSTSVALGSAVSVGTTTGLTVNGTTQSVVVVDSTENLIANQPITFYGTTQGNLTVNALYYTVAGSISANTGTRILAVSTSSGGATLALTSATLSGMTYRAGPIVTQTDPNKIKTAFVQPRLGYGAVANPTFTNRGSLNTTATASVLGDGYADLYQNSSFIAVSGLYSLPQPGSNLQFASIGGTWYKLVSLSNVLGSAGNYSATFQINPALTTANAPAHSNLITTQLKYSQVRLTGHDFLYIGTGTQSQTNYPYVNASTAIQANQANSSGGGRVFFTSTDQDGNFNVGNLFGVQQATGTATLNANAFNLSGLQSLQLGTVAVGVGSAIITQFSSDPYFTANSDNILPTQKAIKSYITAQIGGGQSSLNVNTLTSGVIYVAGNTISTTSGVAINVTAKMNFTGGIDGTPVAMMYFLQR
jgi:hypothetical protein